MAKSADKGQLDVWLYRPPDEGGKSAIVRANLSRLGSDVMVLRCTLAVARSVKKLAVTDANGEHTLHVLLRVNLDQPNARLLPTRIGSAKRVTATDEVLLTLQFADLEPQEDEFLAYVIEFFHSHPPSGTDLEASASHDQNGADLEL